MMKKVFLSLILTLTFSSFAVPPKGFVYCEGKNFMLNGKKYYYSGTNLAEFLLASNERVDRMIKGCLANNAFVLRTWGFANGTGWTEKQWDGDSLSLQPKIGEYNDQAFRRIDYALAEAGKNNIRVKFVLVNNWQNWYHGDQQWYVDKVLGTGKSKSLFYTDPTVKQKFKDYIKYVVTRPNSITGKTYAQDSAIFCWQLCNEPRNSEDKTNDGVNGTNLYNWVNEIAGYIKSLDPNHMVTTGEEGGGTSGNSNPSGAQDGVDFQRNTNCPYIDYACVHVYPTHWGFTTWDQINTYLKGRLKIAHETCKKPAALEEFGLPLTTDPQYNQKPWPNGSRDQFCSQLLQKVLNETGYDFDGFNVWQMSDIASIPTDLLDKEQTNWDFDFTSATADTMKKYGALMMKKIPHDSVGIYMYNSATKQVSNMVKFSNKTIAINNNLNTNENLIIDIYTVGGKRISSYKSTIKGNHSVSVNFNQFTGINANSSYICAVSIGDKTSVSRLLSIK
jgi:mannan endo-1,4-beta-mannosidase